MEKFLASFILDHTASIKDDGAGGREFACQDMADWLATQLPAFDRHAFWDECQALRCHLGHEATGNMGVPWCEQCERVIRD